MDLKFHDVLPDRAVPVRQQGLSLGKTACCYFLQTEDRQPVLKLNETGALIWAQCSGTMNVGQIIELLVEQFGRGDEGLGLAIKKDVLWVLDIFDTEGVITVDSSTATPENNLRPG